MYHAMGGPESMKIGDITPRPYQLHAHDSAWGSLETKRSTLIVMATGTGKTILFLMLARKAVSEGMCVLIMAHMDELVKQPFQDMKKLGIEAELELGKKHVHRVHGVPPPGIVVSSVQTMASRLDLFKNCAFDLIIVDEAHHAHGKTKMYKRVIEHFSNAKVVGVTATEDGAKEEDLAQIFDEISFEYRMPDAISDGWLVPIEQKSIKVTDLDYSKIKVRGGRIVDSSMGYVLEQVDLLQSMVIPTIEIVGDVQTAVFCASVTQADATAELFRRHGRTAVSIRGEQKPEYKKQRKEGIKAFKDGKVQFLCNCMIATEGFNHRPIGYVAMMRAFLKRSRYVQCVGRGTRPLAGVVDHMNDAEPWERRNAIANSSKPFMTIIDYVGNASRHDLVSAIDILAPDEDLEVRRSAKRRMAAGEEMQQAIENAKDELLEGAKKADLLESVEYDVMDASPFTKGGKGPSVRSAMSLYVVPRSPGPSVRESIGTAFDGPLMHKIEYLRDHGIDCLAEHVTEVEIADLYERVLLRDQRGMSTPKQIRLLMRSKYSAEDAMGMTRGEAGSTINHLAKRWSGRQ